MKRIFCLGILLALLGAAGLAFARNQEELYDPYKAEKSLEVGTFYMKKKNYDAAIERFQDALRYRPNLARAHRLLGEAYDKKGEKELAVSSYKEYLKILPSADDAGKVRKRIQQLTRELERKKK